MLRRIRNFSLCVMKIVRPGESWRDLLTGVVCEESGSELIEFALCIYLWIGLIFGVIYVSLATYTAHYVANAAEDGARYAMVRGSTWAGTTCSSSSVECAATSADVARHVASTLTPGMTTSNLTVSATWPGTDTAGNTCDTANGANSPNCVVKVNVSYNFNLPLPFVNLSAMRMTSTSQMTIVQ
jgi:Flp pilus assembly protein TadG